jgi:CHAD domain
MNQRLILQHNDIGRLARDSALNFVGIMFENATGAKESQNTEHLHDMRVASRRLRECFRIFGSFYAGGKLDKILARVKQVTRILGIPREMDVHVALLQVTKRSRLWWSGQPTSICWRFLNLSGLVTAGKCSRPLTS